MPVLDTAIGVTGLTQYSGRIHEEYLRELQGPRWHRVLRRMVDSDPIIGAALFAIEMLLRQVTWDITASEDGDADAEANAAFIGEAWSDMPPWPDTLAEILTFLPHGWVWLELIYKRRQGLRYRADGSEDAELSSRFTDGKTGWACWSPRAQDTLDRWEFGQDGSVRGMWQIAPPTYQSVMIPVEKALHLRTTSRKGNPEGRSILRNTYRPWYFKQNIENIEGIGIERDLAGFPIVRVPHEIITAGGPIFEAYKQMARDVKRDEQEGAVLSSQRDTHGQYVYDMQLLSSASRRQFDTNVIIARYDTRIAMTMLADVILIGHEKVGSFALSSDKTELLSVALGAFLETICCGVQQQAFTRLLRLNGMNADKCPMLRHGDIESTDLAALGAYLESLTKAGMTIFPQPDLEAYLLEEAGLPVPEGGYPPIEKPEPQPVAPPAAGPPAPMEGLPA